MKKLFTLLAGSMVSLSLFALDGNRMSILSSASNLNLKIEVDGQRVRMLGNSIVLDNLSEGNHNVRVYREKKRDNFRVRSGRVYEIIYATTVYFGSAYQVDLTIDEYGRVFMNSYRVDEDDNGDVVAKKSYGYNGSDGSSLENEGNAVSGNIMSAREFIQLKQQIQKEGFEANRLISVKTILDKNSVTVQQLRDLMLLFANENNRVDIAKYAYCKLVDKQYLYDLMDVLSFSSNKDELARFIREPL